MQGIVHEELTKAVNGCQVLGGVGLVLNVKNKQDHFSGQLA
ncbi:MULTISPECIES: hypothetical protein [unclassified Wolbachia]|nr:MULTISPECIES: hypothetical protein [unclassified Wolbachia]